MSPFVLAGGAPGLLQVLLLAAVGCAIPYRFGSLFIDPAILLAYSAVAFLFASNYSAQGSVGCRDASVLLRTALGGALYGFLCWLLILGVSFAALSALLHRTSLPQPLWVVADAFFTLGLSAFASAAACNISLSSSTVKAARDLMRLGLFFILLLLVFVPRLLPLELQFSLHKLLLGRSFFLSALALGAVLIALSAWLLSRLPARLADSEIHLHLND